MASASGTIRRFGAVIRRLSTDFPTVQTQVVERTVIIAVDCAEHLGYAVTDDLVEGLVAESLRAKVATLRTVMPPVPVTVRKYGEGTFPIARGDGSGGAYPAVAG
jgi:hypothetical protein